jgi:dephospho-CoA kinase
MSPLRVGLTGGLASGKSTVARRLADAGFTVVDADAVVADLYRAGQPGACAVAELFGPDALAPDGAVDKPAVARLVFGDREKLGALERRIHPLVGARFAEIAARTEGVAVLEATKLVEAGFVPDFDLVVTVEAPVGLRVARARARGLSEQEARARLAAQMPDTERRRVARVVIENDGDLDDLAAKVDRLITRLRAEAGRAERLAGERR